MQLYLFINLVFNKTVRATIKYSEVVCAKDRFCEFFNKSSDKIRGAIFYDDVIRNVINTCKKYPSIYREDIYDYNKANSFELTTIRRIYEKDFKDIELGAAIYEIEDGPIADTDIKVRPYIFNFEPKLLIKKQIKNSIMTKNVVNSSFDNHLNNYNNILVKGVIQKNKDKIENNDNYKQIFLGKINNSLEKDLNLNGVRICYKCLEKIKLYKKMFEFIDNSKKEKSTNLLMKIGINSNGFDILGLFNKEEEILQLVTPQTVSAINTPASTAINLKYIVVFIEGRLHAMSPNYKNFIPFRLIDSTKFLPDISIIEGNKNRHWKESIERIREKNDLEVLKFKRVKIANSPDESEEFDGIDSNIDYKTVKVQFVLKRQECNFNSYCCLYNCNIEKLSKLIFFSKNIFEILTNYDFEYQSMTISQKEAFWIKYSQIDVGIAEYNFIIDKTIQRLVDHKRHSWGVNKSVDRKVTEILDYQDCRNSSKEVCIKCLKSIKVFSNISKVISNNHVRVITTLGKDKNENPVSIFLNKKGEYVKVKVLPNEKIFLIVTMYNITPTIINFWDFLMDFFILGIVGDEICLISEDFKNYKSIFELKESHTVVECEKLNLELLDPSLQKIVKEISKTYLDRKKFILKSVEFKDDLSMSSNYFGGVNGKIPHKHNCAYGSLYKQIDLDEEKIKKLRLTNEEIEEIQNKIEQLQSKLDNN